MKKLLLLLFFPALLFAKPTVLVSVAPHKYLVERIAQGTVETHEMVPKGASSHTYEPTPKKILEASRADIWFQMGDFFEPKVQAALTRFSPELKIVNLRKGLDLLYSGSCCSTHDCADPHIWLSLRLAKKQAETIADTLSQRYPENHNLYRTQLQGLLADLDQADRNIQQKLQPLQQRTILVSHPAYGYFARDYDLIQLPIECEGKDPSPKQITNLLKEARQKGIKRVFIQEQHSSKGAKLVANQLGAKMITLNPYKENLLENMQNLAEEFSKQ